MKWKTKVILALLILTKLSADSEQSDSKRFTTISFENQTILQDNYTKLEWINGVKSNKTLENNQTTPDGCISFNATSENNNILIRKKAENYCKNIKFASYSDWRVPKDREYQGLIKAVKDANLSIHYNSPSCVNAIGLDNDKLTIINTDIDSNSTGVIIPFKQNNITTCLRCVRDAEEPLAP